MQQLLHAFVSAITPYVPEIVSAAAVALIAWLRALAQAKAAHVAVAVASEIHDDPVQVAAHAVGLVKAGNVLLRPLSAAGAERAVNAAIAKSADMRPTTPEMPSSKGN